MSCAGPLHLPAYPLVSEHLCIHMVHMSCAVATTSAMPCSIDTLGGLWHCPNHGMTEETGLQCRAYTFHYSGHSLRANRPVLKEMPKLHIKVTFLS